MCLVLLVKSYLKAALKKRFYMQKLPAKITESYNMTTKPIDFNQHYAIAVWS